MANLKSELDEYLLGSESRRSKFSLGFSRPSFFSRSSDNTTSTPSSSSSWFGQDNQNDYCSLSRTQRYIGFAACLGFGILCFILSMLYIPFLLLKARKFALLFSLGSLFFILSFAFLNGPWTHIKSLFSKEKWLPTAVYFTTLFATLYCALHLQSTPLTIVFAILQVLALIWSFMGSFPGGSSGMRFFGSMFKSTASNEALTCNVCDRSFQSRRQLSDHQQKKRHFGCSACDSLFPSLMALEHHKEEFQHWSEEDEFCSDSDAGSDDSQPSEDCERLL